MAELSSYSCPDISDSDIEAVIKVLRSPFITQGPTVARFEKKIAQYTGAKYVVAFNSATSALHGALATLGVSRGMTVWTTPITFVATANAAIYCEANVSFVDIDLSTYNMCINDLTTKLEVAEVNGTLPDVVIPVHFAGNPVAPKQLATLAAKYGFRVVEDASHAFGSSYGSDIIGSCSDSDACVFSFHAVKPITAGEGGVVTTNNKNLAEHLRLFRSHGITRNNFVVDGKNKGNGPKHYEQISLGYNYRLSDIHAALGSSQITRADQARSKRNQLAKTYISELQNYPINFQRIDTEARSAYHLMSVRFDNKKTRDRVNQTLVEQKIGTNLHYIPVYKHPYYKSIYGEIFLDSAETYYETALTIPLHTKMQSSDAEIVSNIIKKALADD
jgi:UDP-4-amino-4,6-dideoxy-N-acetyl-beta-L-altrosamine transaminase